MATNMRASAAETESVGSLFRRLGEGLATLLRKELALATSELSRSISQMQAGIASLAIGGAVLFAGFVVLLISVAVALSKVMEPWVAFLIVGAVVTAIGLFMLMAGQKKLKASTFKPERAAEEVREDAAMLKETMR